MKANRSDPKAYHKWPLVQGPLFLIGFDTRTSALKEHVDGWE